LRNKFDLQNAKIKDGKIIADCPFCGHRRDFVWDLQTGFYFCFCCRKKGMSRERSLVEVSKSPKVVFKDLVSVQEVPVAKSYLKARMVDPKYFSYFFFSMEYGPRVVLPVYTNFEFKGFVSRSVNEKEPKYLFSSDFKKSEAIFRFDVFETGDRVKVFENMFSALIHNGVCTFGKASTGQLFLLRKFRCVLMYDPDAVLDAIQDAIKLYSIGCERVEVVQLFEYPDSTRYLRFKRVLCLENSNSS